MALAEESKSVAPTEQKAKKSRELPKDTWIYTFADMLILLLAFFVILFANSSPELERFRAVSDALRGGPPASPHVFEGAESFFEQMRKELDASKLLDSAVLTVDDRGVTISFNEEILFGPGETKLNAAAQKTVEKISRLLYIIPNSVVIEGHTAQRPNDTDAWAISSARAAAVAASLESMGITAKRMEAVGYASSRPKVSNDTPQGRAVNRRVDILIKSDDGP